MTHPAEPLVRVQRVHAIDAAGPRGRVRGRLAGANLLLGPGVHAVLGAPEDGTRALFDVVSGARAPLRGTVTVGGCDPESTPEIRARIGALGAEPQLPDARTTAAAVRLAMRARGQRHEHAASVLEPLGLAPLADRQARALSFSEARAVELALALSTPSPLLVALAEPLSDLAVNLLGVVRERIRDLALGGACVLIITSSPADARTLADRIHLLHKGIVLGDGDGAGPVPGQQVEIVAWLRDEPGNGRPAAALARALADRPEVLAAAWEQQGPGSAQGSSVRIRGEDLDACALALANAAEAAGVIVDAIIPAAPGLGQVRSAAESILAWQRRSAHAVAAPPLLVRDPREGRTNG
jgi:ABC-2 type transport system ATP-binding protein